MPDVTEIIRIRKKQMKEETDKKISEALKRPEAADRIMEQMVKSLQSFTRQ